MNLDRPRLNPLARSLAVIVATLGCGSAWSASFVYEGRLDDGGQPANGRYDFRLVPYAGERGNFALSAPIDLWGIEVKDGKFRVDFDSATAQGEQVWLELAVRGSDEAGDFNPVSGRNKAIAAALVGTCWSTTGDAGSDPAVNFLGTTDAQPLVLRAGNAQAIRIEPSSVLDSGTSLPATSSLIAGSYSNSITTGVEGATISGGGAPEATPFGIGSVRPNKVTDDFGTIGGGVGNQAGDDTGDVTTANFTAVAGGAYNVASASFSTVGGGAFNQARGYDTTVAGGSSNTASGDRAAVAGGGSNQAAGLQSTVGGGYQNLASNANSTVAGGIDNSALAQGAFVGGGGGVTASGLFSMAAGGSGNDANGAYSAVGGGYHNCAGGEGSWAFGRLATVRPNTSVASGNVCEGATSSGDADGDEGTMVWADDQNSSFASTGPNQFLIRAAGGFALNTTPHSSGNIEMTVQSSALNGTDVANLWLKQRASNNGILISVGNGFGSNDAGFFIDNYDGTTQSRRLDLAANGQVIIRSNTTGASSGVTMAAGGGSFTSLSDRHVKTALQAIDPQVILDRVAALPITTWSYIAQGTGIRHIGPMAQDFMAAFQVGETDTGITTIDADGVALAAIQGLNIKLEQVEAERDQLTRRVADLDATNAQLATRLERLERALAKSAGAH